MAAFVVAGHGGAEFGRGLAGRRICVAGLGVSGPPAARLLAAHGALVTAVDSREDDEGRAIADKLAGVGVRVLLGEAAANTLPPGTDLVVTSPGWKLSAPLLAAAAQAGVEVMGDVELAWRLRPELPGGGRQQWLAVTGTNGKTTTVRMLALMLQAAGYRAVAAGNVGTSLADVVAEAEPYAVVAVELSSFQLHWSSTIQPMAAVVLNVAAHPLGWPGTTARIAAHKPRSLPRGRHADADPTDSGSAARRRAARGSSARATSSISSRTCAKTS